MTAGTATDARIIAERLVKAVAHPIRLEALRIFCYRTASANEVAKELGETLGMVTYHVKVLRDFGCIEAVRSEKKRGATEHFYRAVVPPEFNDDEWAQLPQSTREAISGIVIRGIFGEVVRAFHHRTFDARDDRHASWVPMEVDQLGWEELTALQLDMLVHALRIKDESAERLRRTGKSGQRVVAVTLGFETPPGFGFLSPEH
jgi:DNA-binding transcriptional ArsR family regulator